MEKFKNTIMGKITIGAIKSWGENDEQGNWYRPTQEQAEEMVSEGGVYHGAAAATSKKTYGSELAAINGIVNLIAKAEGISEEEQERLTEQLKNEVYEKATLSEDLAARIRKALEVKGVEASIVEILSTIHDNWVKDNGNKFDAPKREEKLYQFGNLITMTYEDDGALADLLFLQPILEGAGIEVDVEGKLKAEFERQQREYMEKHGITDCKGLRAYVKNLEENYPVIKGVTTSKGKTINPPVRITDELKKTEVLERMVEQIADKIKIKYEREVDLSEIGDVAGGVRKGAEEDALKAIVATDVPNKDKKKTHTDE